MDYTFRRRNFLVFLLSFLGSTFSVYGAASQTNIFRIFYDLLGYPVKLITNFAVSRGTQEGEFYARLIFMILLFALFYFIIDLAFKQLANDVKKGVVIAISLSLALISVTAMPADLIKLILQTYGLFVFILFFILIFGSLVFMYIKTKQFAEEGSVFSKGLTFTFSLIMFFFLNAFKSYLLYGKSQTVWQTVSSNSYVASILNILYLAVFLSVFLSLFTFISALFPKSSVNAATKAAKSTTNILSSKLSAIKENNSLKKNFKVELNDVFSRFISQKTRLQNSLRNDVLNFSHILTASKSLNTVALKEINKVLERIKDAPVTSFPSYYISDGQRAGLNEFFYPVKLGISKGSKGLSNYLSEVEIYKNNLIQILSRLYSKSNTQLSYNQILRSLYNNLNNLVSNEDYNKLVSAKPKLRVALQRMVENDGILRRLFLLIEKGVGKRGTFIDELSKVKSYTDIDKVSIKYNRLVNDLYNLEVYFYRRLDELMNMF